MCGELKNNDAMNPLTFSKSTSSNIAPDVQLLTETVEKRKFVSDSSLYDHQFYNRIAHVSTTTKKCFTS